MQALSVCPSNADGFLNRESPPHSGRRKGRNPSFFRGVRSGFNYRETSDDLGYGFPCRCSRVDLYVLWRPKKHSICSSVVPLALAFEEQIAVGKTDSNSDGENKPEDQKLLVENKGKRVDTRALAWSLRAAKTAADVETVLGDKGDLPLQVYSTMIRGFGKDKRVNSAIALVEWLKLRKHASKSFPGPNLFIYNSLLGALKQADGFDQVEKIMTDMTLEGISPNIVTYNTLMGIHLAQGHEMKALELFKEIQTKGLSPSPASYSTALLAYRRMEDGFGALDFYVDFRNRYQNGEIGKNDKNIDWDLEAVKLEDFVIRISYQIMRRWLVQIENSTSKVLKLLTVMDQVGLKTGRSEHEKLIWACTREDHYIVAKELYKRIRESDSEISLSVCNHVIWLLGKAKKWWAALEIYEDLLDKGPKPNNMSYELIVSHFNFLLTAARRKGIWRWGVGLLNKMQEKGLKPGSKEWNSVLIACSKASEASAAIQIFTRMIENGEKPTIISYGALLSALEKGKLYDEAVRVWKHLIKMGVEPNSYAYTIMASIYAAQGKFNIVESIIREMPVSGVEVTVVTFNAIISACARNNYGGPAYEWFQRMEVEKIEANEVSYEMLIQALVKDGKPKVAYDMYLKGRRKGLSLSTKAYDTVVEAAVDGGASIDLSLLGARPPAPAPESKIRTDVNQEYVDIVND
ncbi:protein LOW PHOTOSYNTHETIC EFFICIENCY 1, chloroplastic [Lactuca sativa]|uniref:PROP1-like PPR domain-containing protein n=1 Tax=Lactuca sativa TaxID=4236 RepID=A0A9R1XQX0_LACSA|nr:protein LOW PHOTOSYNTHETIC EFFICIENCY 1, chloroplastic [Lactuca sativa]KAJ0222099.1 hypothetical protein LSAT_V11C200084290 [Lactuca sativa]